MGGGGRRSTGDAAAAWLADATRRGRDATMLVVGSDKGGKTHCADSVVSACAAFLDLHAFRANERAAAKEAEKWESSAEKEKGEKGRATRGSESESAKNEPIVETGLSISVYQTRGCTRTICSPGSAAPTACASNPARSTRRASARPARR